MINRFIYRVRYSGFQLRNFTFRPVLRKQPLSLIFLSPNYLMKTSVPGREFSTKIYLSEFIQLRELKYISDFIDKPQDEENEIVNSPYESLKESFGIQTNELELSLEKASALLRHLQQRKLNGLASPKQVRLLLQLHKTSKGNDKSFDPAKVDGITKIEATEYIVKLKPNSDLVDIKDLDFLLSEIPAEEDSTSKVTNGQMALLATLGVIVPEDYPQMKTRKLIETLNSRATEGKATPRQLRFLQKMWLEKRIHFNSLQDLKYISKDEAKGMIQSSIENKA